jgi:hypothetical protein
MNDTSRERRANRGTVEGLEKRKATSCQGTRRCRSCIALAVEHGLLHSVGASIDFVRESVRFRTKRRPPSG